MFIDKCCIFMGDFMNGKGTGATIDLIKAEAMEEFVAHRDKYNPGWGWWSDNRSDIENKFNNAKSWAEGRPNNFYKHIGDQWKLGTAIPLTINKGIANVPDSVIVNGIKLSEGVFDGKFFANRQLTITAKAPEGKTIQGWKVVTTPTSGSKQTKEYEGSELAITMPSCKSMSIEPVLGNLTGIVNVQRSTFNVQHETVYDLMGRKVTTPQAGRIYIQNGKKVIMK
jgi:hypothetical protein